MKTIFDYFLLTAFCLITNNTSLWSQLRTDSLHLGSQNIKSKLGLSDKQVKQFEDENERFLIRMKNISDSNDSVLVRNQKINLLFKEHSDALKKIFTPSQFEKYSAENERKRKENENKLKNKVFVRRT